MSAPVTEAHRELARRIMFEFTQAGTATASDVRMAAQLIADSEAEACAELRGALALGQQNCDEVFEDLRNERDQLRTEMRAVLKIVNEQTARAESAECEVERLRAEVEQWELAFQEQYARAERAGADLADERAIVSRIWVQLGSPTYEQLKGRSIYCLIDELKAELAELKESVLVQQIFSDDRIRANEAEAILGKLQELHGCSQEMVVHWCGHAAKRSIGLDKVQAELAKAKAIIASIEEDGTEEHNAAVGLRQELAAEREKVHNLREAWLCGHTDGIDCGSGQRSTTDFVTFDEAEVKAHAAKYKGSWTTEGWCRAIPVKPHTAIDAAIKEGA